MPDTDEVECLVALKNAEFTENQIDAIVQYVEFKAQGITGYLKDIEMHDMETRLKKLIGNHGHIGTQVVKPI